MSTNANPARVIRGDFSSRSAVSFSLVPQDGSREVRYKLQPDPDYPTAQLLAEKIAEESGDIDDIEREGNGPKLRDKNEVGRLFNLTQQNWLRDDQPVDRQIRDGDRLQYIRRSVAGITQ